MSLARGTRGKLSNFIAMSLAQGTKGKRSNPQRAKRPLSLRAKRSNLTPSEAIPLLYTQKTSQVASPGTLFSDEKQIILIKPQSGKYSLRLPAQLELFGELLLVNIPGNRRPLLKGKPFSLLLEAEHVNTVQHEQGGEIKPASMANTAT